ncbi:conserved Plasmodium protein, unknown function [Plasmodium knowlesi strain H]|uniref:GYF domain-containing protein n=3 Tax=Plasmodium knowlesi TaxID=5850 RepID=A0A5K1VRA3_PLAKH|nr:conserved Plasmodium protein, unknown function [Plasmodium knowlesi strain H]OTN64786.1 Uncharacterized protein PKNOH_S130212700 [Plasmodium knowlesi]CAA9989287.1 conserved Plasmodium protein, unknown function [Plasmodium knowlesi strain H]SBO26137.1 conserved Plasmodium protein, unknown function [Plasmodium knowlesi strain H]SBO26820.1 conserved Plasmodium protein, unknown function [Plasmodium knowlesi strain H]VVS78761.1 conserved Plasmodium protein, unknown function [Plasmodium knowlesi |eukprot:XP_002261633.1 hypothetical protein, conserved in Plasmodium species [Plasmodium knowlesi strain H]
MEENNVSEEAVQSATQEEHPNEKKEQNEENAPSGENAPNEGENEPSGEKTLTAEDFQYDENKIVYTKNEFLYAYVELILNEKGLGEDHDIPLCSNQFKFPELLNDVRKGEDENNHLGGEEGENGPSRNNAIGDEEDGGGAHNKYHHYRNFAERISASSAFYNNENDSRRIKNDFFTRDANNFMNKGNLQDSTDSNNPMSNQNRRNNHLQKNNRFSKFFDGGNTDTLNIGGGNNGNNNNNSGNHPYGGSKNQFEGGPGEGTTRNNFTRRMNFHTDGSNPAFVSQNSAGNNTLGSNPMGITSGANKTLWREFDKGISSWRSSKTNNKTNENVKNDAKMRNSPKAFSKSFADNMKMTSPSTQNSDDENENNNDMARNINRTNYPKDKGPMHMKREDMFSDQSFAYKNLHMNNSMGQMSNSAAFISHFNNNTANGSSAAGAATSGGATAGGGYGYQVGVNSMGRHAQENNDGVRSNAVGGDNAANKRSVENIPGSLNHSNAQNKNFNFTSPSSAFYGNKGISNSGGPKKGYNDLHNMTGTNAPVSAAAFIASSGGMAGINNVNATDDWKMKKYKKIPTSGSNPEQQQQSQQARMGEEKAKRRDGRNEFTNMFMNKGNDSNKLNMHSMGSMQDINLYSYGGNTASGGVHHTNVTHNVKGGGAGNFSNAEMISSDMKDGRGNHIIDEMNRTGPNGMSDALHNSMGRKMRRGEGGMGGNFSAAHDMMRGSPGHASSGNNQSGIGSTPFNTNRGAKGNQKRETKNEKNVMEDDWSNIRRKPSFVDNKKATDDFMWHKMSEQFDKNNKMSFDSIYLKTDQSAVASLTRGLNYDHSKVGGANNERNESTEGTNHTLSGNVGGNLSSSAFPPLKAKKANDGSLPGFTANIGGLKSNEQQKGASNLHPSAEGKPSDGNGNNKITSEKGKKKKKGDKDGAKGGENSQQNGQQNGQMKGPGENVKMNPKDTSNDNIYNSFHEGKNSALHESSYYKFALNEKKYVHKNNDLNVNPTANVVNVNKSKNVNEKKELIFNKFLDVDKINLQEEHRGMMMVAQKIDEHDLCRESNQQPYRIMSTSSSTQQRSQQAQQSQHNYGGLHPTHGNIIGKTDKRNFFDTNRNTKAGYPFQEKENNNNNSSSSLNERYFLANRYAKYDHFRSRKIPEDRESMMGGIPQESLLQKIKRKNMSTVQSMNNLSNPNDVHCANNMRNLDNADHTNNLNNSSANDGILSQQSNHKEHGGVPLPISHLNQQFNPNHFQNNRNGSLIDLANSPNCMEESMSTNNISYLLSVLNNAEATAAATTSGGVAALRSTQAATNRNGSALLTSTMKDGRPIHLNLSQAHMNNQKYYTTADIDRSNGEVPVDKEELTMMEKQNILLRTIMNKIKMEENIYNKLSESEKEELLKELILTNAKRVDPYGYGQEDTSSSSPLLSMIGKNLYHQGTETSGDLEETHLNLKNTTTSMELINHMYGGSADVKRMNNRSNVATTNMVSSPFGNNYTKGGEDDGDDGNKDQCNLKNNINNMSENEAFSYAQEVDYAGRHLLYEDGKMKAPVDHGEKDDHSISQVNTVPPVQSNKKSSFMNVSRWLKYFSRDKGSDEVEGTQVSTKEKVMQINEAHHMHDKNDGSSNNKGNPSEGAGLVAIGYGYNNQGRNVQQKVHNNNNADYRADSSNHLHEEAEVVKTILGAMKEENKHQLYNRVDIISSPPCALNEKVSTGIHPGRNIVEDFSHKGMNSTVEGTQKNSDNHNSVDISNNHYMHIINRINKIRGDVWQYKDPAGNVQGPFSSELMFYWWSLKYFPQNLPIRFNENMPWVSFNEMFPPGTFPFVFPLTSFSKNNYNMVKKDNEHCSSAQQNNDLNNNMEGFKRRSPLEGNRLNSGGEDNSDTKNYLHANVTASHLSSMNGLKHLNHLIKSQDNLSAKSYNMDVTKNPGGMILTQPDGTTRTTCMYNDKEYADVRDGGKPKSEVRIPERGERDHTPRRTINSTSSGTSARTDKEVTDMEKNLPSDDDHHRDDNIKTATHSYKATGNMQSQNNYAGAHHSVVVPPISTEAAIGTQKFSANYKDGRNVMDNLSHHTRGNVSRFAESISHHDTKLPIGEKGTNRPQKEADQDEDPFSSTIRWMPEKMTNFPKMFEFALNEEEPKEAGEKFSPGGISPQLNKNTVALRNKNQHRATDEEEEEEVSTKLRDYNNSNLNDKQMNKYTASHSLNVKSGNDQPSDKVNTQAKSNNVVSDETLQAPLNDANYKRNVAHHEGGGKAKAKMVPSTVGSGKQAKDDKATTRKPQEEEETSEGYATMKKEKKGKKGKREKGEKADKTDKADKANKVEKTEKNRNKTNESAKAKEKNHQQMDDTASVSGTHWEEAKKKRKGDDSNKTKADEGEKEVTKKTNNTKKKKKECSAEVVGKNGEATLPQQLVPEEQQHREKKAKKEGKKADTSKAGTSIAPSTSIAPNEANAVNTANTASSGNAKGTEKKTEKMKWSITGERKIDKLVDIMKGEQKSVNMKIKIENSKKKMAGIANGNNASGANGTVKKSGWDVSFNTNVKNSDNVNFPHLSTGGGNKQSKAKTGAKGSLPSKVNSQNKDTANATSSGSGGTMAPFSMAAENNNAKGGVSAKNNTDISNKKQSEKKKWKSGGGDMQMSEEDKKFPPLLNSTSVKVESTKKKTNSPSDREITDLKQLTSLCKLPLDDSLLNFLKNFKKADEIYAFLQHSVEDKKKLTQFAKEFIKINSKNDVSGQTTKKKK